MRVTIHQPEYWPLPRLLAKWRAADLFIVLDNAQFDRTSLQHRAKLRGTAGPSPSTQWLTIEYQHLGHPQQLRVLEPHDSTWAEQHWNFVKNWYRSAPADRLREVSYWFRRMAEREDSIGNFAWASMAWLGAQTHISTPMVAASAFVAPDGGWGAKGEWILRLCQVVKAKVFLSGRAGREYLDFRAFEKAGIAVEIQNYTQDTEELSGLHEYLTEGPEHLAYLTRRR